jgi:hypothetical protein
MNKFSADKRLEAGPWADKIAGAVRMTVDRAGRPAAVRYHGGLRSQPRGSARKKI